LGDKVLAYVPDRSGWSLIRGTIVGEISHLPIEDEEIYIYGVQREDDLNSRPDEFGTIPEPYISGRNSRPPKRPTDRL
jgi:hypothetical protein